MEYINLKYGIKIEKIIKFRMIRINYKEAKVWLLIILEEMFVKWHL
jgi:hypothetical protein